MPLHEFLDALALNSGEAGVVCNEDSHALPKVRTTPSSAAMLHLGGCLVRCNLLFDRMSAIAGPQSARAMIPEGALEARAEARHPRQPFSTEPARGNASARLLTHRSRRNLAGERGSARLHPVTRSSMTMSRAWRQMPRSRGAQHGWTRGKMHPHCLSREPVPHT